MSEASNRRLALIDLEAIERLPPRRLKVMLRLMNFMNPAGAGCPSLNILAMHGMSWSSMSRELAGAVEDGDIERALLPGGGYEYRIPERLLVRKG